MYVKVLDCINVGDTGWIVALEIDQPGVKTNSILSSSKTGDRWVVESRILYAQFRKLHKAFPFEKHKVIRLDIPEGSIEKLKLDLLDKENKGIFQYFIKRKGKQKAPELNETLLCAGY